MRRKATHKPSHHETDYVQALSRESVIEAYANWTELSGIEQQCLDMFLGPSDRVLDLGCGAGRIPRILGERLGSYLGVDCSSEMIRIARSFNPEFKFLCEDILEPSFSDRDFDLVLLMNNVIDMLHPIERRQEVFSLIKNRLGHGGLLFYSSHLTDLEGAPGYYQEDYHGATVNSYRSTFGQLCEEVESCGFEVRLAARDYRSGVADWAYIVADKKCDD